MHGSTISADSRKHILSYKTWETLTHLTQYGYIDTVINFHKFD